MIVCTQCAHHNEDSDEFCGNCGEFLEWAGEKLAEPAPPEAATEPEPAPPAVADPPPAAPAPEPEPEPEPAPPPVAAEPPPPPAAPAPEPKPAPPAPISPAPVKPVAPTPAPAQPAAVLPGRVEPKRPAATTAAKAEPAIKPGDVVCPSCGVGNDPERKFCRKCGTSLAAAVVATKKTPWWKKLFQKKPKVHAAGERPMRAKKGRR